MITFICVSVESSSNLNAFFTECRYNIQVSTCFANDQCMLSLFKYVHDRVRSRDRPKSHNHV